MKKLIYMLFLIFIFPIIVSADITTTVEFIEELGGSEYASLIDGKITLKKDILLSHQLYTTQGTYIIDLNGYNIVNHPDNPIANYILYFKDSNITLEDSKQTGSITITEDSMVILSSNTNLIINNIKMKTVDTPVFVTAGTVKINGGEYTSTKSSAFYAASATVELNNAKFIGYDYGANLQDAKSTITNCEMEATASDRKGYGVNLGIGELTINSGIFKGTMAGLKNHDSTLLINNGTFISTLEGESLDLELIPGGITFLSQNELADDAISKTINSQYTLSSDNVYRGREHNLQTLSTDKYVSIINKEETITYTLENLTTSSNNKYFTNQDVSITLKPNKQFILPQKISIKISNKEITDGYTYDSTTGEITIPKELAIGPIEVIAIADVENPNTSNNRELNLVILLSITLSMVYIYITRANKLKDLI